MGMIVCSLSSTGCSPPPLGAVLRDLRAVVVWWRRLLAPGPGERAGYLEQCRQLTQARAEHQWLAAGF